MDYTNLAAAPTKKMAKTCISQLEGDCCTHNAAFDALINLSFRLDGKKTSVAKNVAAAFCMGDNQIHIHVLNTDGSFVTLRGSREEMAQASRALAKTALPLAGLSAKALCYLDTFEPVLFKQAA
jgi:hypothetical protein